MSQDVINDCQVLSVHGWMLVDGTISTVTSGSLFISFYLDTPNKEEMVWNNFSHPFLGQVIHHHETRVL